MVEGEETPESDDDALEGADDEDEPGEDAGILIGDDTLGGENISNEFSDGNCPMSLWTL